MNEVSQIEMRLWDYIDGDIDAAEKAQIEELLRIDVRWQSAYKQLLHTNKILHDNLELDEPSVRFTKNVMDEISKLKIAPATKNYINKKIINGIAAFFAIVIGGGLLYFLTQINWSATSGSSWSFDVKKLDASKYLSKQALQIFVIINAVLVLILIDKILLRKKVPSKRYRHS
jgi:hypothetical protein